MSWNAEELDWIKWSSRIVLGSAFRFYFSFNACKQWPYNYKQSLTRTLTVHLLFLFIYSYFRGRESHFLVQSLCYAVLVGLKFPILCAHFPSAGIACVGSYKNIQVKNYKQIQSCDYSRCDAVCGGREDAILEGHIRGRNIFLLLIVSRVNINSRWMADTDVADRPMSLVIR